MSRRRGFSLVELVVGMTAGAGVALMAFLLFTPAQNWLFTESRRTGMSEGSAAIMRIMREVGRVKAPADIQVFLPSEVQFTDVADQPVHIQQVGTDVQLNGNVLARHVSFLDFTYLDQTGAPATTSAQIRTVRAQLGIAIGPQMVRLESAERIRNLP